jgi:hypothetical protein
VGEDEVDRLPHRLDSLRLLISDPYAVTILQFDDELYEIQGIGLEVFLEPTSLIDSGGVDPELPREVIPDKLEHLLTGGDHLDIKPPSADPKVI